jgi:hypothetical protein
MFGCRTRKLASTEFFVFLRFHWRAILQRVNFPIWDVGPELKRSGSGGFEPKFLSSSGFLGGSFAIETGLDKRKRVDADAKSPTLGKMPLDVA